MNAKYLILLGFLAMALYSWALWSKMNSYKDIDIRIVKKVLQIEARSSTHFVFSTENKYGRLSRLEVLIDSPQGLREADGVLKEKPISIGYVCGFHKDCGKLPDTQIYNAKIHAESLKIFVYSYDEIKAIP